jgi:pSer/pThr/pTyr-binding forkhead associated (FHA) protein
MEEKETSKDRAIEVEDLNAGQPSKVEDTMASTESLLRENSRLTELVERLRGKVKSLQSYAEDLRKQLEDARALHTKETATVATETDIQGSAGQPLSTGQGESSAWETDDPSALVAQVTLAAAQETEKQFLDSMDYEASTGLYYHSQSGLYYDAERRLYYDGAKGVYYEYNYETGDYQVHSTTSNAGHEKEPEKAQVKKRRRPSTFAKKSNKKNKADHGDSASDMAEDKIDPAEEVANVVPKDENDVSSDSSSEEEGEINDEDIDEDIESEENNDEDHEGDEWTCAPCVRVMVLAPSDQAGSLFLVTCTGGSLGRNSASDVHLHWEEACSQHHARMDYHGGQLYRLTDLDSTNGTYVNGRRLSKQNQKPRESGEDPSSPEPDTSSSSAVIVASAALNNVDQSRKEKPPCANPIDIGHGSVIRIGNTRLLCHVHPNTETCMECEPGVVARASTQTTVVTVNREEQRKSVNARLRKKYALSAFNGHSDSAQSKDKEYRDRAHERRKKVGSTNPHEKTQTADVTVAIDKTNKGFAMLAKMGWRQGDGLGKDGHGRAEPIHVEQRAERAGLGSSAMPKKTSISEDKKAEMWLKTRDRFNEIAAADGSVVQRCPTNDDK